MADLSQPNEPFLSNADIHLARLLAPEMEEPWYKSLIQNIKDAVNPPKLPPLEVTSKPVAVKDIWGLYGRQKKSFMASTAFQVAIVVLVFTLASSKAIQEKVKEFVPLIAPIDLAPPPVAPPKKQMMAAAVAVAIGPSYPPAREIFRKPLCGSSLRLWLW